MKGSKDKLISLVSVLQIIVYMPIYQAQVPANLQIFIKALRKIAEFKIVEEDTIFDLFGFENPLKDKGLTDVEKLKQEAFMQSGCKSFNILENMGYFIILLGIFIVFLFILSAIFTVFKAKRHVIKKKGKAAAKAFFWNGAIQSTNLTYLKSFVSFALATKMLSSSKNLQFDASSLVTILLGALLII